MKLRARRLLRRSGSFKLLFCWSYLFISYLRADRHVVVCSGGFTTAVSGRGRGRGGGIIIRGDDCTYQVDLGKKRGILVKITYYDRDGDWG